MRTTTIINQELKQAFDLVEALLVKHPTNQDLLAARQIAEEMSQLEMQYQAVVAKGGTPSASDLESISKAAKLLENKFVDIAGKEQAAVMMSASKKRSSLLPGIKIHTADFLGELQKNNPFDLARLAQEVMKQHPELLANDTEKDLVKFVEKAIYPKGMPTKDKAIIAKAQQLIAKMNKTGRSLKVNDLSSSEVKILENGYRVMSGLVSAMHNKVVVISGKTMVPDVDVAKNNLSELSAMLMAKKNPPKELKGNTNAQLLALEKEIRDEDSARNLKDMATRLILQCAHAVGVLAREANKQHIQVEKAESELSPEPDADKQKEISEEIMTDTSSSAGNLTDDENEFDDSSLEVEQKVSSSTPKTRQQLQEMLYEMNPELKPAAKASVSAPTVKAPDPQPSAMQRPPSLLTPAMSAKPEPPKPVQLPSSSPKVQTPADMAHEQVRNNFSAYLKTVLTSFNGYKGDTHKTEQDNLMRKVMNLVANLKSNPMIDVVAAKALLLNDMQSQLAEINKNKRWYQPEGNYSKLLKTQIENLSNYTGRHLDAANLGTTKQIMQQMNVDPAVAKAAPVKQESEAPMVPPPSLVTPPPTQTVKAEQTPPNLDEPKRRGP